MHLVTLLAYTGPDQILPLASILATVVGFVLFAWQYLVGLARRAWRTITRRAAPAEKE